MTELDELKLISSELVDVTYRKHVDKEKLQKWELFSFTRIALVVSKGSCWCQSIVEHRDTSLMWKICLHSYPL